MKKLIAVAAVLAASFAFLGHSKAAHAPAPVAIDAPALESPVVPSAGRDVIEFARVGVVEVPEVTIIASAPARHAETDAEHVARLMAAPVRCGESHDNWIGGRNADCR